MRPIIIAVIVASLSLGACIDHVHLFESVGKAVPAPAIVQDSALPTTRPVANASSAAAAAAPETDTLISLLFSSGEVVGGLGAAAGIAAIWAIRRFARSKLK